MNDRQFTAQFRLGTLLLAAGVALALTQSCAHGQCTIDQYGRKICPPQQPAIGWTQGGGQRQAQQGVVFDIKVIVQDRDGGESLGSGTPIYRTPDGGTAIVTNEHVVRDRRSDQSVRVTNPQHYHAWAKVVGVDQAHDLAILVVPRAWRYVGLGEPVQRGTPVQIRGWALGRDLTVNAGQVLGNEQYGNASDPGFVISVPAIDGMSGGGVFGPGGTLVGVTWGTDGRRTSVVGIRPVRRLLSRLFGEARYQQPAIQCPPPQNYSLAPNYSPAPQQPPGPQAPAPQYQAPQNQSPLQPQLGTDAGCDCKERFAAIDARLLAMEAALQESLELSTDLTGLAEKHTAILADIDERIDVKVAAKISKFPPRPGPPGPAGKSPSVDEIATEVLKRLENQGTKDEGNGRILYFTSTKGCAHCSEIDEKIKTLKSKGYPITIVDLDPAELSVAGVPRLFVPETNQTVEGIGNLRAYLASLVPR